MIITHTSPDWDAIGSCWLLQRYGPLRMREVNVRFVPTGTTPPELDTALAVVDTGKVYDPTNWRFDHHQMMSGEPANTCAMEQVAMRLLHLNLVSLDIWPIVNLVWAGDIGANRDGHEVSRSVGIHAMLSGLKRLGADNQLLLETGYRVLDAIAEDLSARNQARRDLAALVAWKSDDGQIWALNGGGSAAGRAASELGARLVVYVDTYLSDEVTHYSVGCFRYGENKHPHIGDLVGAILDSETANPLVASELAGWFRHPMGFFAGSGSAKAAPRTTPIADGLTVEMIAAAIDAAWRRS